MISGDGVFGTPQRESSPASSDLSVSSVTSSEYFSCFSESGSGLDSDVISVSSDESIPKRPLRSTRLKSKTLKRSGVRARKKNTADYFSEVGPAKRAKRSRMNLFDPYEGKNSAFIPVSCAHRRKKTTPVKFLSNSDKQSTLVTKKSKYMRVPPQNLNSSTRLHTRSQQEPNNPTLRYSSQVSSTKTSSQYNFSITKLISRSLIALLR